MSLPFLKREKFGLREQDTFIGKKCEIYLPKYYINKTDSHAIAKEIGERVNTTGIFWYNVDGRWYELQLPLKFEFQFSEKRTEKLSIRPGIPAEEYIIYTLYTGDAFVYNILHKKDLEDFTKDFLGKIIEGAKLPSSTAYSDVLPMFLNAMSASGTTNVGVASVSLEFLLSEIYRDKKNMRRPFRESYSGNEYDYKMMRITKIPELNSTFTSLLGEDIQNQLIASVLRTREGSPDRESPVEKVIKY